MCGFEWDSTDPDELPGRVRRAAEAFAVLLEESPETAGTRPSIDHWSALEYGCHVRDVFINLRDRIILGAVEDNPTPRMMHGTPRVDMGLYALDTPAVTANELRATGELFARSWEAMPVSHRLRPILYTWPRQATRTLAWVASQALHEAEHHLTDARECVRMSS